jgi:hypothetical protein
VTIRWTGKLLQPTPWQQYEDRIHDAAVSVAEYFAPILESYAKDNKAWTDQTGNARQSMAGFVEEVSRDIVVIYLAHGVDYGIYLEARWSGRYAIIWPTIEAHLPMIREMLQGIFS